MKDFISKQTLFDEDATKELQEIAGEYNEHSVQCNYVIFIECELLSSIPALVLARANAPSNLTMEVKTDRSNRLLALRGLLHKLPQINFNVLRFIFQHFARYVYFSHLKSALKRTHRIPSKKRHFLGCILFAEYRRTPN